MDVNPKDPVYYSKIPPILKPIEVVMEPQEEEISVTEVDDEEDEVYSDEYPFPFYVEGSVPKKKEKMPHIRRRNQRFARIRDNVSGGRVDIIDLGKTVVLNTVDNSLKAAGIEKAVKSGQEDTVYLGDVSMEALVHGLFAPDAFDARFAMVGSSVMWNILRSNMSSIKSTILMRTTQTQSESRFETIDLNALNIPRYQKRYGIRMVGVFANADLNYVFSLLTFRSQAKLLNKTKQFLKAYFIVACRPRCMIWRYTMRRSGASHKKAILHLPPNIVQTIIGFLLELTGIGQGDVPYETLDPGTPFYQSLGEDKNIRETRYNEACQLKDALSDFFRDCIIDCLNEVREMPFCLSTGNLVSPLRGRALPPDCVTWKEYETILKTEHDFPSKAHTGKRVEFEGQLCQAKPRQAR